jgi:hypothetical protein
MMAGNQIFLFKYASVTQDYISLFNGYCFFQFYSKFRGNSVHLHAFGTKTKPLREGTA